MLLQLKSVRITFPELFVAKAFSGDDKSKPAFSATFLIDPKKQKDQIAEIEKLITESAKEKWDKKADAVLKALKAADKTCLHDGENKADYEGFPGSLYISARTDKKPDVRGKDAKPISNEDGIIYSGCYVNAWIDIYPQDNGFGKRINATLKGVQFVKDGDAFSGGAPLPSDAFSAIEEEEDEINV